MVFDRGVRACKRNMILWVPSHKYNVSGSDLPLGFGLVWKEAEGAKTVAVLERQAPRIFFRRPFTEYPKGGKYIFFREDEAVAYHDKASREKSCGEALASSGAAAGTAAFRVSVRFGYSRGGLGYRSFCQGVPKKAF